MSLVFIDGIKHDLEQKNQHPLPSLSRNTTHDKPFQNRKFDFE